MALVRFRCLHCHKTVEREASHVNRACRIRAKLFCSKRCDGLHRRKNKSAAQKKAEKREYDKLYRARNLASIKAKKAAYFKATYDPDKARIERKRTMARHVEYCRQPKYKAYKSEYDRQRRAKEFGPFAESHMLIVDLNREIKSRSSNHDIYKANDTLNKRQSRLREDKEAQRGRPRARDRRDRHQTVVG